MVARQALLFVGKRLTVAGSVALRFEGTFRSGPAGRFGGSGEMTKIIGGEITKITALRPQPRRRKARLRKGFAVMHKDMPQLLQMLQYISMAAPVAPQFGLPV